jgi:sodium-dependent dicarboxylate transporter 2/3/5
MDAGDARTDSPDATETGAAAPSRARIAAVAAIATAASALCLALIDDPVLARAAVVAGVFLILSLTEIVPPFVPVLVLLVGTPVLMGSFGAPYRLPAVLN